MITRAVGSCDVLLALIGEQWLTVIDEDGRRRLDDPDDFVRAGDRGRPGPQRPRHPDPGRRGEDAACRGLPASLAKLVRRQALELSPGRFEFDTSRLLGVLDRTLAEVRKREARDHSLAQAGPSLQAEPGRETTLGGHRRCRGGCGHPRCSRQGRKGHKARRWITWV